MQSPLNITGPFKSTTDELQINYETSDYEVLNNGHTIQVNVIGSNTIQVKGKTYKLLQFHFHLPSEEQINGKHHAMVTHFVHRASDGSLAVIGLFLDKGAENSFLSKFWVNLPRKPNEKIQSNGPINITEYLPMGRSYWGYSGSLTTPPCTEGVLFYILRQNSTVSANQMKEFESIIGKNARPIQSRNRREILLTP